MKVIHWRSASLSLCYMSSFKKHWFIRVDMVDPPVATCLMMVEVLYISSIVKIDGREREEEVVTSKMNMQMESTHLSQLHKLDLR